jgi:hypothetical protein
MIEYRFTERGEAFAKRWSTPEAVLAQAKVEVDGLWDDPDEASPEDLIFHVFWLEGDYDKSFIVTPDDRGQETVMVVDVALYEDVEMMDTGVFAGKTVRMPVLEDD